MAQGQYKVIFFTVGNRKEKAEFPSDISADQVKELFRGSAEAGPNDILKMYTTKGSLVNISPRLESNSEDSPYRLEVVAAQCNGMIVDQVGSDLLALEERVSKLERMVCVDYGELPEAMKELKGQVDSFRDKLESAEHLSWLGFYKDLHSSPCKDGRSSHRMLYRRKSDQEQKRVMEQFSKISDVSVSEEVRDYLRMPTFDNWQWEDEEILLLMQQMYLEFEFPQKFNIELGTLRRFLYEVYRNYNDVPFHNFRHCFCVAQMMYGMAWCVNLRDRIGDLDTLILITSCICHDLDHPGFNNIYQINAKTELALRYNDISPLENHHCSVAFRILEQDEFNIFRNFPAEEYKKIREGMIRCILATDMARHNEILNNFKEISPNFDFSNRAHINLLSMVLIKVADISNEARPLDVAEPWLDLLLQEFFQQSDTEKLEGLPVTPFMDRDKITKPSSQCSFIGYVLLPLFEALGAMFPELEELIITPVRDALEHYRRLNELAREEKQRRSTDESVRSGSAERDAVSPQQGQSDSGVRSPGKDRSSRKSSGVLSAGECAVASHPDGADDDELDTEADVSERALKFKIATDVSDDNVTASVNPPIGRGRPAKTGRSKDPGLLSRLRLLMSGGSRDKPLPDENGSHHPHNLPTPPPSSHRTSRTLSHGIAFLRRKQHQQPASTSRSESEPNTPETGKRNSGGTSGSCTHGRCPPCSFSSPPPSPDTKLGMISGSLDSVLADKEAQQQSRRGFLTRSKGQGGIFPRLVGLRRGGGDKCSTGGVVGSWKKKGTNIRTDALLSSRSAESAET